MRRTLLLFAALLATTLPRAGAQVKVAVQPVFVEAQQASTTEAPAGAPKPATAAKTAPSDQPILHLANGDFATGELVDADDPEVLRWKSPIAAKPFDFLLKSTSAVHFPVAKEDKPTGEWCLEMIGGDLLFGSLVSLSKDELVVDTGQFGPLHINRREVGRLARWENTGALVYFGPNGLRGWNQPSGTAQWREEAGELVADGPGATITADVRLPERAAIDFDISWKNKADFVLALGLSGEDEKSMRRCFRFEAWDSHLVALFELDQEADLKELQDLKPGPGHAHLQAYLDQKQGRLRVYSTSGQQLADLSIKGKSSLKPGSSVQIINHGGDVCLERLRVTRWNGEISPTLASDQWRIQKTDGSAVDGQVQQFDAASKQFVITQSSGEVRVDAKDIASITLGSSKESLVALVDGLRAVTRDGTRASGKLEKVAGGKLNLKRPGIKESLIVPVAQLQSILVLEPKAAAEDNSGRAGRLELDGFRSRGSLVDGEAAEGASCLTWRPALSKTASALVNGISGKLIYHDPPPPLTAQQQIQQQIQQLQQNVNQKAQQFQQVQLQLRQAQQQAQGKQQPPQQAQQLAPLQQQAAQLQQEIVAQQQQLNQLQQQLVQQAEQQRVQAVIKRGGVQAAQVQQLQLQGIQIQGAGQAFVVGGNLVINGAQVEPGLAPAAPATAGAGMALFLRNGDTYPVTEITRIDEHGVSFKSPFSHTVEGAAFVAHEKIKALELAPERRATPLEKVKRERLLTLPRMQKNNPPTQLIVSTNGDYLRGRLTEMTEKTVTAEIHLESKQLSRANVARIVWLHSDELDESAKAEDPPADASTLVQALRSDGIRMTFTPLRVATPQDETTTLYGNSEVLGPCQVALSGVDQLLIGRTINENAALLTYGKWKLHNAVEPKYVQDDEAGPSAAGTQSALVGKPAPDFELRELDGGKFRLSGHKGHVVVLDFFATWCGPCVQAMPQVEAAVHDFKDQGVELVAVNMQEDEKKIKSLLERLDLKPTVALDQDGATAEKYSVTAIPQTVIIDPKGNVARLFIGGGANFGDTIHDALKDVLSPPDGPKDGAN
jgi:peroxiredoxin